MVRRELYRKIGAITSKIVSFEEGFDIDLSEYVLSGGEGSLLVSNTANNP